MTRPLPRQCLVLLRLEDVREIVGVTSTPVDVLHDVPVDLSRRILRDEHFVRQESYVKIHQKNRNVDRTLFLGFKKTNIEVNPY